MPRSIAEAYATLFEQYKRDLAGFNEARKRLAADECQARGEIEEYLLVFRSRHFDYKSEVRDIAQGIAGVLVGAACQEFAPAGGKALDISTYDLKTYERCFHANDADPEEFDPVALWDELEKHYGGEAGKRAGYQDAATRLVRQFGLARNPEMKTVGGQVAVSLRIALDDIDLKFNGAARLSYYSQQSLQDVLVALSTVAIWAGDEAQACAFQAENRFWFNSRHDSIQSRAKRQVGTGVTLVTYKSRFEFRLSPAFARALQTFLGQFGRSQLDA